MRRPEAAVVIAREDPAQPEVLAFLAASDAFAASLYPAESNHLVDVDALRATSVCFLVARITGEPRDPGGGSAVGCGALVLGDTGTAEIKRMWVDPETRGFGVGRKLLDSLLGLARRAGVSVVRLETGIHQPQAIGLYRTAGFTEVPPFGAYRPDSLSVFLERRIGEQPDTSLRLGYCWR